MRDELTPAPELSVLALRYAANDLPATEADAFEERLGKDQAARDALAEAIRLSASAVGQVVPAPSATVRSSIRDRLFPTWLTVLFPRRSYRGHPAAWATVGACATAIALLLVPGTGNAPLQSPPYPIGNASIQVVSVPVTAPIDPTGSQDGAGPSAVRAVDPMPLPMPMPAPVEPVPANG